MNNVYTKTKNVNTALKYIDRVRKRDVIRQRGLMLIYGIWGIGKTWFGERFAAENGFIFMRLYSSMRQKDFLITMIEKIYENLGNAESVSHRKTSFQLFEILKDVINTEYDKPPVIIIDEIDYAVKHNRILDTIRDIADDTIGTFICIGMQNAYSDIKTVSPYFFNRWAYTLQFHPNDKADMTKTVKEVSEFDINDTNIDLMVYKSEGNMRNLIKIINHAELIRSNVELTALLSSKE